MVAPDAGSILFLKSELVLSQHILVLVGGVHIKEEDAARFHEKARIRNGGIEVRDVVERVKSGHRTPDGAVEVELEQVLLQEQELARKAQLFGLVPNDAEHLLGLVDADHIVARLGQHQGQFPGTAAQVRQDAVPDAVGLQLAVDVAVKGVVVGLAVELIVKIGKFVVSHRCYSASSSATASFNTACSSGMP